MGNAARTLEWTVYLVVELARAGYRRDPRRVLRRRPGRCLCPLPTLRLDPLAGHLAHRKRLDDPGATRATLKQLARLGHAFVVSDEGVALSMVRLAGEPSVELNDPRVSRDVRRVAAASVSGSTDAIAVVSGDSAVLAFQGGMLAHYIYPSRGPGRHPATCSPADRFASHRLRYRTRR